ncbi:hypothetical protein EGT74_23640 [Chitinophaga lutea]|uniref:Uncharacterized protein n=1 Tax=Chitinophaga lutea TaxID=2488634 RepID=A0A3N4P9P3_9BACT|nr:hypothetical protein [Chitinophaga lutea]RPE05383.1 hypothetical protein EGT74_23640 [Chitinophaga lutea]
MKTLDLQALQLTELHLTEQAEIGGGMDGSLAYDVGQAVGRTAEQIIGGTCAVLGNWAMAALKWD